MGATVLQIENLHVAVPQLMVSWRHLICKDTCGGN